MRLMVWAICFLAAGALGARPLEVRVKAKAAILMNAETGAVLYEKHAHVPSYPASVTKIATALYVLDEKGAQMDRTVTVSAEALQKRPPNANREYPPHWNGTDGTTMGLVKGETVSVEALLHGLMLVSGNDAANVLAEAFGSSIPGFVEEMNGYLRGLGCLHTQFKNPHGYHHPEHFTTAYDLCLMMRKALRIPKFRQIVSTLVYNKLKTNKQPPAQLRLFNQLMTQGAFYYPKAIGGKTGYHSKAQNTLAAAAEHEGRTLIAVLLGCENRNDRYEDAIRLFEAAFAEEKQRKALFGAEHIFTREVTGSKIPLKAALQGELALSFYPAEEPDCKAFIHWELPHLPIRKGQKVGEIQIVDLQGVVIEKGDLLARDEIKGTFFFRTRQFFSRLKFW